MKINLPTQLSYREEEDYFLRKACITSLVRKLNQPPSKVD